MCPLSHPLPINIVQLSSLVFSFHFHVFNHFQFKYSRKRMCVFTFLFPIAPITSKISSPLLYKVQLHVTSLSVLFSHVRVCDKWKVNTGWWLQFCTVFTAYMECMNMLLRSVDIKWHWDDYFKLRHVLSVLKSAKKHTHNIPF